MIAELPPLGVMYTKVVNGFMLDHIANMEALRPLQRTIRDILHNSEDRSEAQRAVLEKRKPVFKGR